MLLLLSPPPPPPPPAGVTTNNNGSNDYNKRTSSQEIQFDASAVYKTSSQNDNRNKSVQDLEFDPSQQLLLEASQALTSTTMPTPRLNRHNRKNAGSSKDSTDTATSSDAHKEINFNAPSVNSADQDVSDKIVSTSNTNQTEDQILQEKIFGKAVVASSDDEEDDNYDYFDGLPSELPVNSQRYLECNRSMNLSPVSCLTSASYMFDNGGPHDEEDDDDEDENGPRKALHNAGFTKRLPMEEYFDSDEEDDTKGDSRHDKKTSSSPSNKPVSITSPKPTTPKPPKGVIKVKNQNVNDKYGDGGIYSGNISVDTRLPHGSGKMKYDNGREFEGDWRGGRWHGSGRWVNPNGDEYIGDFVYDARHVSNFVLCNGTMYLYRYGGRLTSLF